MIAIIRVRFKNTPPEMLWSDSIMHNWMNPTIPFSLAHYWTRTSFFQADMRYYLFPSIDTDDPRLKTPMGGDARGDLVVGVTAEVTRLFTPNWDAFDQLIILFAQPTDLFGSSGMRIGGSQKLKGVAVCDLASPFDAICQEVGHAFGLDHELDSSGEEYMSPYSSMSAQLYGGAGSSFIRPPDARLPDGTNNAQRIIGPYITPAQFYLKGWRFLLNKTIYEVPYSYATTPHSFRLTAVDKVIDNWPVRKVMLAALPPLVKNGDSYFLELRRASSYDSGFSLDGSDNAPIAVVLHAVNFETRRVRYVNRIPLMASPGDRDYHCFKGFFTVRLNSFEEDFSSCGITVGGGDFWKYMGIGIVNTSSHTLPSGESDWMTANVSPCIWFTPSAHQYRYHFKSTEVILTASSFGYEKPNYSWFLNDKILDPANSIVKLKLVVRSFVNGGLSVPAEVEIEVSYSFTGKNTIKLVCNQKFTSINATLKIVVNETSQEVLKNFYPDRDIWTGIQFNNVNVEWDQAYKDKLKACQLKELRDLRDRRFGLKKPPIILPGPRPNFGISIVDIINQLVETNPAVANVVINEVVKLGKISKLEVLKRLK